MLSGEDISFLTRMGERIIGVLIGGMCVYLGYSLFKKIPNKTNSSGKLILPGGVSIWLSRVGPGTFFALFGAAIVITAFTQGVVSKSHELNTAIDRLGGKVVTERESTRRGIGI